MPTNGSSVQLAYIIPGREQHTNISRVKWPHFQQLGSLLKEIQTSTHSSRQKWHGNAPTQNPPQTARLNPFLQVTLVLPFWRKPTPFSMFSLSPRSGVRKFPSKLWRPKPWFHQYLDSAFWYHFFHQQFLLVSRRVVRTVVLNNTPVEIGYCCTADTYGRGSWVARRAKSKAFGGQPACEEGQKEV